MPQPDALCVQALQDLLTELVHSPGPDACFVLDPKSRTGLLDTLAGVTAVQASRVVVTGHPTIAQHAGHLRYHLELLARYADGEPNPFATADWPGSWQVGSLDGAGWVALQEEIAALARRWIEALPGVPEWDAISLTGAVASVAHLAYHLGAIRPLVAGR